MSIHCEMPGISGKHDDVQKFKAISNALDDVTCKTIWQWLPGHSDVEGNELADQAAKRATNGDDEPRPVTIRAIRAEICNLVPEHPPTHSRTIDVYSKWRMSAEKEVVTRADQVYLARLRSGHHPDLMATKMRLKITETAECPRCGYEEENVVHWLSCPGTMAARMEIFGKTELELSVLTEFPKESIALARKTIRGAEHPQRPTPPYLHPGAR